MNIFILSSDPKTIRFLTGTLRTYREQKFIEVNTKVFRRMRDYLVEPTVPDLIFVDDNLEMKPCIENARVVRNKDNRTALVLLSSNSNRVFEAFTVKTHRFLTKPVSVNDVFDAIDSYRKDVFSDRVIIARVDHSYRVFSSEEVYALIADGSHPKIMTNDELVDVATPFNRLENQLPDEYFYKCHRSYVINLQHIAKFSTEQVELENHSTIPISRRKRLDFHMKYSEFVKGHTFRE